VAKAFNQDEIKAIGGDISSDGDFLIFESNRYSHKGFLYKTFQLNGILTEGVTPTLAELERFGEVPVEGLELDGVASAASTVKEEGHNFATGDNVEVAEGELAHLQGKIIAIDGNKITIMPRHEDLKVNFD
jgi:transcription elongation factor SPT5